MKKEFLVIFTLFALTLVAQITRADNGWEFLPITGDSYQADLAVAVVGGRTEVDSKVDNDNNDTSTLGIEASINCPLLKAPNHTIRQQVSYVETDKEGLATKSFELNPHHMLEMGDKMQAGFGPSLGSTKIETRTGDDTVFTYGLGASIRYDFTESVFMGGEARYAWSKDIDIVDVDKDFDNFRMLIKVGYQF